MYVEAVVLPAGPWTSLRVARWALDPVRLHHGPVGQGGGAAPMAQAEPHLAVVTPHGMAARAGPTRMNCAATSSTTPCRRLGLGNLLRFMPPGSLPHAGC